MPLAGFDHVARPYERYMAGQLAFGTHKLARIEYVIVASQLPISRILFIPQGHGGRGGHCKQMQGPPPPKGRVVVSDLTRL